MITQIMDHLNNHFIKSYEYLSVTFDSTAKTVTGSFSKTYLVGQYIYIKNSTLNDGAFKITTVADGVLTVDGDLLDSTETVWLYGCAPPRAFLSLVDEIIAWNTAHGSKRGVASERIDDYALQYAQNSGWKREFRSELSKYRRIYDDFANQRRYY